MSRRSICPRFDTQATTTKDADSMSNPRVLILTSTFLPTIGGVQFELKWFLDNLDNRLNGRDDLEVHFAYPNADSDSYSPFDNIRTHNFRLGQFSKYSIPKGIVRLGRLLRRVRPDVVHCHGVLPEGLWAILACRLYGVRPKIIVTSHGHDIAWLPHISYGLRKSWRARLLARYVVRRICKHVLVSHAMIDYALETGTSRNTIVVIPNGIPLGDEYNFEEESISDAPAHDPSNMKLCQGDGVNFLSLSSGRVMKNLETLVEAFSLARDGLGDSKLLLACVGPQSERIVRLVGEKGLNRQVEFIGEVLGPTKHAYFRASDVYCLPSHFEPFGIVALEAMKFQTAVLATQTGGVKDFIEDGENGLLVSPTNVQEIASALLRLYRDPELRSHLVRNGLETVKHYSITRIVDEYISLYTELSGYGESDCIERL